MRLLIVATAAIVPEGVGSVQVDPLPLHVLGMGGGDLLLVPDNAVALAAFQPHYEVRCMYRTEGRSLAGAHRVWMHVGHSGWQDTTTVELQRVSASKGGEVWVGAYRLPVGRLVVPSHFELQFAFKGSFQNELEERWDNNSGRNWSLAVEVAHGEGLIGRSSPHPQDLVSSLLVRVEALTMRGLLTPEQGALLRTLTWQHDFSLLRVYDKVRWHDDNSVVDVLARRCGFLQRPGLHVIHIASEMAPLAKVGGLGDVVTSLAKAHQSSGTLAEIIIPKYDCIRYADVAELRELCEFEVPWDGRTVRTVVWSGISQGLPVYFIEPHSPDKFFWRGQFYGESDDAARFLFFARAALEFLLCSGKQPDVLHVHDWQTAVVAPLLKEEFSDRGLVKARVVLTIHNIAFQGWLTQEWLEVVGMERARVATPERMLDDTRPGFRAKEHDINLLRGGVVYADRVTTVSPTYAREVYSPVFGMGLEGVLAKHSNKFLGVLNGIDHETWDPETDALIPCQFGPGSMTGKEECKKRLLIELCLPYEAPTDVTPGRPLIAVVSRLSEQKGLPLIKHAIKVAARQGAQFVILGSAPDPATQAEFERMAIDLAQGGDARLILRYDEMLAHRIYAGADIILIPSFFEPCGLTQLIALRYGTVPVVRETGGLADTVKDVARSGAPDHERNGFTFPGRDDAAVEEALGRAIDAYNNGRAWWKEELVPRVMRQDWSWSRSAEVYLDIYRSL